MLDTEGSAPSLPSAQPGMAPEAPQRLCSHSLAGSGAPISAPEFRAPTPLSCPRGFSCTLWKGSLERAPNQLTRTFKPQRLVLSPLESPELGYKSSAFPERGRKHDSVSLAVSRRGKRQAGAMKLSCLSDCITGFVDVFSALTLLHVSAAFDTANTSSSSQRALLCAGSAFPGTPSPSPWGSFAGCLCAPLGSVWSHLSTSVVSMACDWISTHVLRWVQGGSS